MRYMKEKGIGLRTSTACVPIVPAAVLYDLDTGNPQISPGINEGYAACQVAGTKEVPEGSVGAGTGATVCKLMGLNHAIKGGIGTASKELQDGTIVAAIFAVNALGDIIDHTTGKILASPRFPGDIHRTGTIELLQRNYSNDDFVPTNTTIGIVATNASLTKEQVNKIASMAHDGMARAINPSHTMYDGDTIFALSLGDKTGDVTTIGAIAAELTSEAIKRAVIHAETLAGVPAINDIEGGTAC
jgi:L-aminopeptidase/D-esterase-like protein